MASATIKHTLHNHLEENNNFHWGEKDKSQIKLYKTDMSAWKVPTYYTSKVKNNFEPVWK